MSLESVIQQRIKERQLSDQIMRDNYERIRSELQHLVEIDITQLQRSHIKRITRSIQEKATLLNQFSDDLKDIALDIQEFNEILEQAETTDSSGGK